ncbi:hypothetical protein [uncultured Helicobacter sp.]|uniref:hypothetical protein n=1 Tax=uncultured Helicobacter sp. TaxID=175537 RepID=UPI0026F23508|nr:hypothetical protein [uncultured Helicobacter sp.]
MSLKHLCLNTLYTAYHLYAFIRNAAYTSSVSSLSKSTSNHIFILANGPSLKKDIQRYASLLNEHNTLMMNHSITQPIHHAIQPKYHIVMDSVYFIGDTYNVASQAYYQKVEQEVKEILSALERISYPLTLLVPNVWEHLIDIKNPHINIQTFGIAKFKGFDFIARFLFQKALALPSYYNVLIPSIICCIAMGYKYIYLLGCDYNWFKNYFVNTNNTLFNDYKHLYNEDETLCAPEKIHLYNILHTDAEIFQSYHILQRLFTSTTIYNLSSHSAIDAFPRSTLADILAGGGDRVKLLAFLILLHSFILYRLHRRKQ